MIIIFTRCIPAFQGPRDCEDQAARLARVQEFSSKSPLDLDVNYFIWSWIIHSFNFHHHFLFIPQNNILNNLKSFNLKLPKKVPLSNILFNRFSDNFMLYYGIWYSCTVVISVIEVWESVYSKTIVILHIESKGEGIQEHLEATVPLHFYSKKLPGFKRPCCVATIFPQGDIWDLHWISSQIKPAFNINLYLGFPPDFLPASSFI